MELRLPGTNRFQVEQFASFPEFSEFGTYNPFAGTRISIPITSHTVSPTTSVTRL